MTLSRYIAIATLAVSTLAILQLGCASHSLNSAKEAASGTSSTDAVTLRLALEGPFALCFDDSSHKIRVLLPDLVDSNGKTHFKPFIRATSNEVNLDNSSYELTIGAYSEAASMLAVTQLGDPVSIHTKFGGCQDAHSPHKYLEFKVPQPNHIYPTLHIMTTIVDRGEGATCGTDVTGSKPSPHARQLVLEYDNVHLKDLNISGLDKDHQPRVFAIGNSAQMILETRPKMDVENDTLAKKMADADFRASSDILKTNECITFAPDSSIFVAAGATARGADIRLHAVGGNHNNCRAPLTLVCPTANVCTIPGP